MKNEVKITFMSLSVNESFARQVASSFTAMLDPTVDELADIKTAVSEAVTNCIVHAYPDTVGKIMMTLKTDGDSVTVSIKDKGIGIPDVKKAMEPCYTTAPTEERSGMGFTVMEAFVDKVKVTSKEGKGTKVTLKKYIGSKR
ncbi:MAG: anti-sigma F factor [Clostridia bacterium]|nr:anti-sigma F factor [Clostridia bacterium]